MTRSEAWHRFLASRRSVIISPHDDDALLGAAAAIQLLTAPIVVIVADRLSNGQMKGGQVRRKETSEAYATLGVASGSIIWMGLPELNLHHYRCWSLPDGRDGAYKLLARILRRSRASGVLLPASPDTHPDHEATFDIARTAIGLARLDDFPDLGQTVEIPDVWGYRIWDPLERSIDVALAPSHSLQKRSAVAKFVSQRALIADMVAERPNLFEREQVTGPLDENCQYRVDALGERSSRLGVLDERHLE